MGCFPVSTGGISGVIVFILLGSSPHVARGVDVCGFSLAFNADTGSCEHPYDFCGEWGAPVIDATWNVSAASNPTNATFVCECTHARAGDACDVCDAAVFCASQEAGCAESPHDTHWCVCSNSTGLPTWRPWWRGTDPQAPCDACQEGFVRNATASCVPLAEACGGSGVDPTLTQVLGRCVCHPGFAAPLHGACDTCIAGFVLDPDDGLCKDCDAKCGGTAYAVCDLSQEDDRGCVCNEGVAGPPCVAGECLPGRVWDSETQTCPLCPAACGDAGNGTCAVNDGEGVCVCGPGWVGDDCAECAADAVVVEGGVCRACPPCAGGVCVARDGEAVCECPSLWAGDEECTTCTPGVAVPSADFRTCVGCDPPCSGSAVCTLVGQDTAECVCPEHSVSDGGGGCLPCDSSNTTGPLQGCVSCPVCTGGRTCSGAFNSLAGWAAECVCAAGHTWAGQCVAPVAWPEAAALVVVDDGGSPVTGTSAPVVFGPKPPAAQQVGVLNASLFGLAGVVALLGTLQLLVAWFR